MIWRMSMAALSPPSPARPLVIRWCVYVGFLLMLVMLIPRETPAPFIYFQF